MNPPYTNISIKMVPSEKNDRHDLPEEPETPPSKISMTTNLLPTTVVASDVEAPTLLYEHPSMMFSILHERGMRLALTWKDWSTRIIKIYSDGSMTYARPNRPQHIPRHHVLILKKIEVVLMTHDATANVTTRKKNEGDTEKGLLVKCVTADGAETQFRCLATDYDINKILGVLKTVAVDHNIDDNLSSRSIKIPLIVPQRTIFGKNIRITLRTLYRNG